MKRLLGKKGLTLVEVVLSIAIIATIALPLYSVFGQSIKTDRAANDVLNANYIAQDYLEKLNTTLYLSALNNVPNKSSVNGYFLSAAIRPYGTANSLFSAQCSYIHLVMYGDNSMLAIMPDGKYTVFGNVPSSIILSLSGSTYSFTGGSTTITGSSSYSYCALIINAMAKPSDTKTLVTLSTTNCKAVVYCGKGHTGDITLSPTSGNSIFENEIKGDTSLIHVTASVYVLSADSTPVSSSESYINIKNW